MNRSFFILICFFFLQSIDAQYLHTPSDIKNIHLNSNIKFKSAPISDTFSFPPLEILTFTDQTEFVKNVNSLDLATIKTKKRTKKYLKKGDKYFSVGKFEKALGYYKKISSKKVLKKLTTKRGICYEQLNKPILALKEYHSLLAKDKTNASVHFGISKIYHLQKKYSKSCEHILYAHLYNRNNLTYRDSMISFYKKKNKNISDYTFQPKFELNKTNDTTVYFHANLSPWKTYAACSAVWAYEPGYKEKMKYLSSQDIGIIEEKECLLNALIAFERLNEKQQLEFPILKILSSALPEKKVDDFILYEITSRKYPIIMSKLPLKRLDQIKDYILHYRATSTAEVEISSIK